MLQNEMSNKIKVNKKAEKDKVTVHYMSTFQNETPNYISYI